MNGIVAKNSFESRAREKLKIFKEIFLLSKSLYFRLDSRIVIVTKMITAGHLSRLDAMKTIICVCEKNYSDQTDRSLILNRVKDLTLFILHHFFTPKFIVHKHAFELCI